MLENLDKVESFLVKFGMRAPHKEWDAISNFVAETIEESRKKKPSIYKNALKALAEYNEEETEQSIYQWLIERS